MARFLSYVLRHHPEAIGIELDAQGWVAIPVLLQALSEQGHGWTRRQLEEIVRQDNKQRYCIQGDRIRAQQGHSLPVELELSPAQPPERLYHGTTWEAWPSIQLSGGLRAGERHHVHLSSDPDTARKVGERRKRQRLLLLKVDAGAMARVGHTFYQSGNGVWLIDRVPLEFLQPVGDLAAEEDDG